MELVRVPNNRPRFSANFGDRLGIEDAEFGRRFTQRAAQVYGSGPALLERRVIEIRVGPRVQNFERELSELPGAYAAPTGALLLGIDAAGQAVGCVAVRPLPAAGGS